MRHQDNYGNWSGWSAETSFTTINRPPDLPTNVSPANGATGISLTPTLQSSAFSDPDTGDTNAASQWQITAMSGQYSSPLFDSSIDATNLTSIIVPPGTLTYSTTYYWMVRHQDNNGAWSDWSAETSFTAVSEQDTEQLLFGLPLWAWIAIGAGVILIIGVVIGRVARR